MKTPNEFVAFRDQFDKLVIWPLEECKAYKAWLSTVYARNGQYASIAGYSDDGLATLLSPEEAAALIAGGGTMPPKELLELLGLHQQSGNSTSIRKRRTKPKSPPGSHGLRAFNSRRLADSRGTHDRRRPDSHPTHEGNH